MAIEASRVGAQFVVSVGDNFYEDGVSSTDDPQWKISFRDVYSAPSLAVPWYCVLGNHDYQGNPQAQVDYSALDPRWRMPARYYTHAARIAPGVVAEFFFIDTTPYHSHGTNQSTRQQTEWLKQALGKSRAAWKIVVGHHPIYSGGEHGPIRELWRQVRPLLKRYGVQAYFNGHDHDLQHLRSGAIDYFDCGAGSRVRETGRTPKTVFAASVLGFMSVAISPNSMTVRIIDSKGTILHTANVTRSKAPTASSFSEPYSGGPNGAQPRTVSL